MNEVITIGVDLAKNIFQVHGIDAEGDGVEPLDWLKFLESSMCFE